MEQSNKWLEAIVTVVFDLEEGQLTDYVIPKNYGTEKDRKTISYNSFPDSFTFNLEGQLLYSFYLRKEPISEEREIVHCYSCFSQRKDKSNSRGYFQKSIVFLTKIKIYSFMKKIFADLGRRYFEEGSNEMLDQVYNRMNTEWPSPTSLEGLSDLELFGTKYQIQCERDVSYKNRFEEMPDEENTKEKQSSNELKPPENTMLKRPVSPNKMSDSEEMSENLSVKSASSNRSAVALKADFDQINLYSLLGRQKICLIFKLWEAMMLSECLLVMADNPAVCSELVFAMQSLTAPFESVAEFYPYMTVFDKEMDLIKKNYMKSREGIVIGATNPLFVKNFEDFPNILRLDKDFEEGVLRKNLIMKTVKTNTFLKTANEKRLKGESVVKKFLTNDLPGDTQLINNSIVRRKLEKLSFGIAGLISTYFSNQKNDLKLFDGAQFLKSIKEMNSLDFMEYFGGKSNLLKFMADFICTRNFQTYIQKHFNVHLTPVKINNF